MAFKQNGKWFNVVACPCPPRTLGLWQSSHSKENRRMPWQHHQQRGEKGKGKRKNWAIDGCHIPVRQPALNHTHYYNRKGWYSVILQAVVDDKYLFRDVMVGWPGSVHDARVLSKSQLYRKVVGKEVLNTSSCTINGMNVLPFLLGDSAYPLSPWLMKPFPNNASLSSAQRAFNYRLSRARIVVENALKARWRRLMKQTTWIAHIFHKLLPHVVFSITCVKFTDAFNDTWFEDSQLDQPHSPTPSTLPTSQDSAVRDSLVQYFLTH